MKTKEAKQTPKQLVTDKAHKLGITVPKSWSITKIEKAIEQHGLDASKDAKKTVEPNAKALKIIDAIDALASTVKKGITVKSFLTNSRVVKIDEEEGRMNNAQWATLQNIHKAIKALNPNVPHKATFIIHPSGSVALYSKLA